MKIRIGQIQNMSHDILYCRVYVCTVDQYQKSDKIERKYKYRYSEKTIEYITNKNNYLYYYSRHK